MIDPEQIKSVAVYPPLGIARVGNAEGENDYFFATEVANGTPADADGYRDSELRIKRQAVRFRIYATLKSGEVIELVDSDRVSIEWRVEVANLKSSWYQFNNAMDLPEQLVSPAKQRNPTIRGERRLRLDITPRARSISGRSLSGPEYAFDDGQFWNRFVYLGELRTDDQGRLIFLGGRGVSAANRDGLRPLTFANNDNWHDDVCDGPVRARVTVSGQQFEATPGYVAVTPPNYGPGLFGVVTMEDTLRQSWTEAGWLVAPTSTSFTNDVWPIFERMSQMSWVNHGLFVAHGIGSPLDARNPEVIDRLRDPDLGNRVWRTRVFNLFLPADRNGPAAYDRLPQQFGDGYPEAGGTLAIERLSVTELMYSHLERWKDGAFDDDWPGGLPVPPQFDSLDAKDQLIQLERAALVECLGGPFHPGIELTWNLRHSSQWQSPYRLAPLPEGEATQQDFGPELTRDRCLGPGGPLHRVGPGSLTRWLGVPWQTDEASCNSDAEYAPSLYLSMPSFWGARVPEQVLSEQAWSRVSDPAAPTLQRIKHFMHRDDWLRDVRQYDYYGRILNMVKRWSELGILLPRETTEDEQAIGLPHQVWIENGRSPEAMGSNDKVHLIAEIEGLANAQAVAALGAAEPRKPHVPPRIRMKRGEV